MLAAATPDTLSTGLFGAGTFVALFLGYLLGFAHAVWRRARADYQGAKQSVPRLRNNKWAQWWSMVQRGAVVVLAGTVLLVWLYGT